METDLDLLMNSYSMYSSFPDLSHPVPTHTFPNWSLDDTSATDTAEWNRTSSFEGAYTRPASGASSLLPSTSDPSSPPFAPSFDMSRASSSSLASSQEMMYRHHSSGSLAPPFYPEYSSSIQPSYLSEIARDQVYKYSPWSHSPPSCSLAYPSPSSSLVSTTSSTNSLSHTSRRLSRATSFDSYTPITQTPSSVFRLPAPASPARSVRRVASAASLRRPAPAPLPLVLLQPTPETLATYFPSFSPTSERFQPPSPVSRRASSARTISRKSSSTSLRASPYSRSNSITPEFPSVLKPIPSTPPPSPPPTSEYESRPRRPKEPLRFINYSPDTDKEVLMGGVATSGVRTPKKRRVESKERSMSRESSWEGCRSPMSV